jgi:site-specific DNA-methyltransferase (adenine-specific)
MDNEIITGDCFEELNRLDANSVHAVVTDPPYGLAFMGRSWDDFEPKEYQEWCEKWATECLRVLKPGGHLLAFSGNRTHHRLMSGIEDAGYEIRDTITWHYGSGFPKALDVSKAIDEKADADREVVGEKYKSGDHSDGVVIGGGSNDVFKSESGKVTKTEPATEQAKQWDGFKSALKPATEFVCVARSPLAEDTIAENVVTHGTGALNIDATRVETDGERPNRSYYGDRGLGQLTDDEYDGGGHKDGTTTEGRYPSNVVFDAQQADVLDDENDTKSGGTGHLNSTKEYDVLFGEGVSGDTYYDDHEHGGPSRYFYTSKASKAERTLDGKIDNAHPTVKPIDLMEWLVCLATAEEQIVGKEQNQAVHRN